MGRGNPQSHTVKCEQEGKMLAWAPASGGREPGLAEQHEGGMTSSSVLICRAHRRQLSVGEGTPNFTEKNGGRYISE